MNIRFLAHSLLTSFVLFSFVSCGGNDESPGEEPEKPKEYQLVFADEFDGNTLNVDTWNYEIGGSGWGNQEKQYYTDRTQNVRVENGNLIIKALKENYENNNYTSGRITTKGKFAFKYGKIEARISLPAGRGTWTAFWMMPENSEYGRWPNSGEIDIMEYVGSSTTMISHAVHTKNKNTALNNNWSYRISQDNVENQFHVYSMEWIDDADQGDDCIIFYVDGVESTKKWQPTNSDWRDWPYDKEFFIIFNLAMGGSWGGTIDDSIFASPVEMKVDYVRVYQKKSVS